VDADGEPRPAVAKLADLAGEAGLRRVSILAWRDLDDPEAGGSELHASILASRWAEAGIDVTMRTSYAPGHAQVAWRNGYRVIRKAGRYMVFPRAAFSERMGWHGDADALLEIWNGMPFFAPLWARTPHATWVHHVHAEMWAMTLPRRLAALGNFTESRLAPVVYRRTPIITPSESTKRELVEKLRFRPSRVTVVQHGVDSRFSPGGERSAVPLVLAVGRLVPVKRFDLLVDTLVELKARHPALEAIIVGEGYRRDELEAQLHDHDADRWIHLPGYVAPDELVDLYRRAWVLASASAREGWGMTITEAAACGTPAVVTDVVGHRDSVADGVTGLLGAGRDGLEAALDRALSDPGLRARLGAAGRERVAAMSWDTSARMTLEVLAAAARRRQG
jgi:glycosyltransferase involved in cell wall biosynthesis